MITGAHNLSVTADGNQTALVTAFAGALANTNANSQTLAGSFSSNTTAALIDTGSSMALSGSLTVDAEHHATNIIFARSDAASSITVSSGQALATPVAVNVANETATTRVAGTVTAAGAVTISANADVQDQAESTAGASGADDNSTTATGIVAGEIAFLQNRANLVFGSAPAAIDSNPDLGGTNSNSGIAAAVAVNLGSAGATANLAGSVTATGSLLTVSATGDVDSNAVASAQSVTNIGGAGAAVASMRRRSTWSRRSPASPLPAALRSRPETRATAPTPTSRNRCPAPDSLRRSIRGGCGNTGARDEQRVHRKRSGADVDRWRRSL